MELAQAMLDEQSLEAFVGFPDHCSGVMGRQIGETFILLWQLLGESDTLRRPHFGRTHSKY
jgi:hypothetical protein